MKRPAEPLQMSNRAMAFSVEAILGHKKQNSTQEQNSQNNVKNEVNETLGQNALRQSTVWTSEKLSEYTGSSPYSNNVDNNVGSSTRNFKDEGPAGFVSQPSPSPLRSNDVRCSSPSSVSSHSTSPAPPTGRIPECDPTSHRENNIKVELHSRELWAQFNQIGNEMIITKAGRRIFPALKVKITGLDPDAHYILWVDVVAVDKNRYRYVYPSSQWMVAGTGDPPMRHNSFVHIDSPSTGRHWMSQVVSFEKLKLSNNKHPVVRGQVTLHSMHKYQPRIHVQRTNDLNTDPEFQVDPSRGLSFTFPETVFITVTAYQNQQITRLKIASNPFAKGFRDTIKDREGNEESGHHRPMTFDEHCKLARALDDSHPGLPFAPPVAPISVLHSVPYFQGSLLTSNTPTSIPCVTDSARMPCVPVVPTASFSTGYSFSNSTPQLPLYSPPVISSERVPFPEHVIKYSSIYQPQPADLYYGLRREELRPTLRSGPYPLQEASMYSSGRCFVPDIYQFQYKDASTDL